jgi:uncharacterized protein with FMN-binding domain
MKRTLIIVGGTLSGLGAVLAITPPQLGVSDNVQAPLGETLPGTTVTPAPMSGTTAVPSATATPTATAAPSSKATSKPNPTKTPATKPGATQSATPAATKPAAPSTQGVSGTFTGDPIDMSYGIMQIAITVVNGKITDAQAVRVPSARNDRYTNMAVPVLRQKTLAAQNSQITGVSGASYTSFGWFKSLQSALTKAGLPL